MIFAVICLLLAGLYCLLIILYLIGFIAQRPAHLPAQFVPKTSISIIIPARNERANIIACIDSMLAQNYPAALFKIIVVDDHSDDDTALRVLSYKDERVVLIHLANHVSDRDMLVAFKKKALAVGITCSAGDLIITTDADCIAGPKWLASIAALYEQTGAQIIVAPVDFTANGSVVETFQSLDFMTMQGITAAAHKLGLGNMANGANLAFTRAAYEEVNGYEGVDHFASGDDYLLMTKIKKRFPNGIRYLKTKQAIISTAPQPDWSSFFQQRVRWASKSGKYKDYRLTTVLLIVYLFNISIPAMLILGSFQRPYLQLGISILLGKILLEMMFLLPVSCFFGKLRQLLIFPFLQPLHILYICCAGVLGWRGKFHWKGRSVN